MQNSEWYLKLYDATKLKNSYCEREYDNRECRLFRSELFCILLIHELH